MRFHNVVNFVRGHDQKLGEEFRIGVIVCVPSTQENHICGHRFLRRRTLWFHVCDNDVEYSAKFALLEDKHLVMQTSAPIELGRLFFEILIFRLQKVSKSSVLPTYQMLTSGWSSIPIFPRSTSKSRALSIIIRLLCSFSAISSSNLSWENPEL